MAKSLSIFIFLLGSSTAFCQQLRSFDGYGNNLENPAWGSVGSLLLRESKADYVDQISVPKLGEQFNRPNPRAVSNIVFEQTEITADVLNLSDFTWAFGQFIEHEISYLLENESQKLTNIVAPANDRYFTPGSVLPMNRSLIAPGTGLSVQNPAGYQNRVTSFIDGSAIYGSDLTRANWLRTMVGGRLKMSEGDLLPWNTTDGQFNSNIDGSAPSMVDETGSLSKYFIAGDERANQNHLLLSIHTVFAREHNRLADQLKSLNPNWSDEQIYQKARHINVGILQNIIFEEWLQAMGLKLPQYAGYRKSVNPAIMNVFSAAAFRLGQTLVNGHILRMDDDGNEIPLGSTSIVESYFNPLALVLAGGIDPYLKGMSQQVMQNMDCKIVDDVRNFAFNDPKIGRDFAAININRGRDHGLPSFNEIRATFGLPLMQDFYTLTKNHEEADILESVYKSIDNLDPWVGMIGEYHMPKAMMGRLMMTILEIQFQSLRDGDRFYFEVDPNLSQEEKDLIRVSSMQKLVLRNTEISALQSEVFKVKDPNEIPLGPDPVPLDLRALVFPNPSTDQVQVNVHSSTIQNVNFEVFDVMGRLILKETHRLTSGVNRIPFNLESFPRGLYNIKVSNHLQFTLLKLIKE